MAFAIAGGGEERPAAEPQTYQAGYQVAESVISQMDNSTQQVGKMQGQSLTLADSCVSVGS